MRRALMLAAFLVLLFAGQAVAAGALPTWPVSFSLRAGESTSMIVPVTAPGEVRATVTWRGAPLTVQLMQGDKVLATATGAASPLDLRYAATEADVRGGVIWRFTIAAAGGATPVRNSALIQRESDIIKPALTAGQVTATYPEPDPAAFSRALDPIVARQRALAATQQQPMVKRPAAGKDPAAKAYLDAETARVAAIERTLVAKFTQQKQTESAALSSARQALAKLNAGRLPVAPPVAAAVLPKPRGTLQAPVAAPDGEPKLVQVAPTSGCGGDVITIQGKFLSATPDKNEVFFCLNASSTTVGRTLTAVPAADGTVTLTVEVPLAAGVTSPFDGQVYLRVNDRNPPAITNPLPFRAEPLPVITQVTPDPASSNGILQIKGTGFHSGDTAMVVMPDGTTKAMTTAFKGATLLQATMPAYTTTASVPVSIFVNTTTPTTRTAASAKAVITCLPSQASVTGFDRTQAKAGEVVRITGKGFVNPVVTFAPNPGQSTAIHSGTASGTWTVDQWTETQILVRVPGYALLRDIGGTLSISGPNLATPIANPFTLTVKNALQVVRSPIVPLLFAASGSDHTLSDMYPYQKSGANTDDHNCYVFHHAGFFDGHRGDDMLAVRVTLKNGWRYHHIYCEPWTPPTNSAGSRQEATWIDGAGNFCTMIHWWVDAIWSMHAYSLYFYIEGPEGVPYQ